MATQGSSTSSTSDSLSLPSSLSFLIANFQSFITIRLESSNYFAWKTQVENALKANNLFDFVENSTVIPVSHVLDASGSKIPNPEFHRWITIDRMLLSCLIATLNPSVLPHIVGSEHTFQFWNKLEEKFSLLSRSHIHDLKRRLYSLNKTGTMDQYLDSIKEIVQKLAASGHYVDDEDLIFHTLNGLRTGYGSFKQAIRTRTESISFGTFASMLMAEDLHMANDLTNVDTTSVLVTQTPSMTSSIGQSGLPYQTPGVLTTGTSQPLQPFLMPYQFPFSAPPPQQFYPSNYNTNNRFNRNNQRYNRNQSSQRSYPPNNNNTNAPSNSGGCQICGKSNHLADSCYHRQNLSYRPPGKFGNSGYNTSGNSTSFGSSNGSRGQLGYGSTSGNGAQALFVTPKVMGYYGQPSPCHGEYASAPGSVMHSFGTGIGVSPSIQPLTGVAAPTTPWLLDSGATSHVTHDQSQIQASHGGVGTGVNSVTVGNGQAIPVAHSGQSYPSDPPSRELSQGTLPYASFF